MNRVIGLLIAHSMLVFTAFASGRILVSLYALNLGASSAEVGVILSLLYLVPALLSWPIGVMADRMGARWLLAASSACQVAAMMAPFFYPGLGALYVASIGIGLGVGFSNVIGQNLVGVLSTPETRARNFSNYSLCGGIANFIGPVVTGFFIDHVGFKWSALIGPGMTAVAVLIVLVWGGTLPRGKPREKKGGSMLSALAEPKLRRVLYISSINQVGVDCFVSFMPVYAHGIGLSASVIGGALSAMAAAMLVVRVGMARVLKMAGERKLLMSGFMLGAGLFFILPVFKAALLLTVISFVFGLYVGIAQPIIQVLMFNLSPPGRGGEAMGLRLSVNNVMRVAAPVVFGAAARGVGMAPLFVAVGALMCLAGYLCREHPKSAPSA